MKTTQWVPNPEGPAITGESIEGQFGPSEKEHEHEWYQRGMQNDYNSDTELMEVSAVMVCSDSECGAALLEEWVDDKHTEDAQWKR